MLLLCHRNRFDVKNNVLAVTETAVIIHNIIFLWILRIKYYYYILWGADKINTNRKKKYEETALLYRKHAT